MTPLLVVPLLAQAGVMLIDELYFHRRRGLPKWERIGHPLDTLSVLACYAVAVFSAPTPGALSLYVGLSLLSCLFITKDEFVHASHCRPAEHWLHALLFVLHPLVLGAIALLWLKGAATVVMIQALLTLLFGCYQLLYWNLPWPRRSLVR
jgi:hypothetical protein